MARPGLEPGTSCFLVVTFTNCADDLLFLRMNNSNKFQYSAEAILPWMVRRRDVTKNH